MACLNTLKLEIKTLEQIFTKSHERFQVLTATVDELTCRFIGHNNRRYDIHANITVGNALFFRCNACCALFVSFTDLLILVCLPSFVYPPPSGNVPLDASRVVRRDGGDHHNQCHTIT